jgi:hypothetical protein
MADGPPVVFPQIKANPGQTITVQLIGAPMAITGNLVEIEYAEDGGARTLALQDDPARPDPLCIRGDLISMWRLGKAATPSQVVPAIPGALRLGPDGRPHH